MTFLIKMRNLIILIISLAFSCNLVSQSDYVFTITDSYGDGLCGGCDSYWGCELNGNVEITDCSGDITYFNLSDEFPNGNFGSVL